MTNSKPKSKNATSRLTPKLRFPEFRDGPEWEQTTIGHMSGTVTAGGTPNTSESSYWSGDIRWMNSGELNLKRVYEVNGRITERGLLNSSTKVIPRRCVLIGLAGQGKTRGTIAMNMVELCINQSIAAVFPNDFVFKNDYLYHNLDNRYDELRKLSTGGEGRGGLNLQIIKSLKIPLPSLPEQQKIAECLNTLDELIGAESRKLDALKSHKQGLMQQLFPREGETRPRLRFPEFQDGEEWDSKPIGEVYTFLSNNSLAREMLNYQHGSIRNIHYGDIHTKFSAHFDINKERVPFINPSKTLDLLRGETFCIEGDIILADASEDLEDIGKCIEIVQLSGERVVAGLHTIHARQIGASIVIGFSGHLFKCKAVRVQIQKEAQGTKVYGISANRIAKVSLPIPRTKAEQQGIADCLSSLDDLIVAQSEKLDALKSHKKGLIQQLFPSPEGLS